jgi:hypothetical protein
MGREKVTITLDRAKAADARSLTAAGSTSEAIDIALSWLIRVERLRRDIAAYRNRSPTSAELELALLSDTGDLADTTDWDALYPPQPT